MNEVNNKSTTTKKTPLRVLRYILPALPPVVLIVFYYISIGNKALMNWVNTFIALPYRAFAAKLSSLGFLKSVSLYEVLLSLLILWALYFIVRTIVILIRRPRKLKNLLRRLFVILTAALYLLAIFSWLWDSGYHSESLSEKTGLDPKTATVAQLKAATSLFAQKANEYSDKVKRDDNGRFIEKRDVYFPLSKDVYSNIVREFPALNGTYYPPKPIFFSKVMSFTGFTGVYIALTGEANLNVDIPGFIIPVTIAHEMAHQRGVNSEEEANFAAIAASVTSGIPVYEYSGYLLGLMYLMTALNKADPAYARQTASILNDLVLCDWRENSEYWSRFETKASETAAKAYDGYLKSNGVEKGIESYGECVSLLSLWVSRNAG